MENKNRILGVLVCAAMAAALCSFFAPFCTTGGYYPFSATGVELIQVSLENGTDGYLTVVVLGTCIGFVAALVCLKDNYNFVVPMIISVISCVSMWIGASEAMDYVANGFWMFIVAHAISVVLCGIIWVNKQATEKENKAPVDPVKRTPVLDGASRFCPECGTRQEPGVKFCPKCGTPQSFPVEKTET